MLIKADARHIPLKAGTVQCVVTSPPYWGLRDYGLGESGIGLERTPEEYVAQIVAVFREVWRVLRGDGTVWLNLGDSYASNAATAQNPAKVSGGFESYRGSDTPTLNTDKQDRIAYRGGGIKPKDLVGIPWRVAFALQADGWYLRSDIIWAKPNPMPESVRDRPTKAHEYIFLLTKSAHYFWDQEAVKEPCAWSKSWSASNTHTAVGQGGKHGKTSIFNQRWEDKTGSRNLRTVWTIATQPYSGAHFATFPREIPERCIKAGTKPGDIVLDPFCGSGTTVMVARALGRVGVGLDLTYQQIAAERLGGSLFKEVGNSAWCEA